MKALLLVLVALVLAPVGFAKGDEIDFTAIGKEFLKSRFKATDVAAVPLETIRTRGCVHGAFGYFDVSFPAWQLVDKDRVEQFRQAATALVQLQSHWMDWVAKGKPGLAAPKADADALLAWIKGWKAPAFLRAPNADDKDVFVLLDAPQAVRDASKRLDAAMRDENLLGVVPRTTDVEPMHVLFAPSRRDFVDLLAYTGLQDPNRQKELWSQDATVWTNFWSGWTIVLALEYPPWSFDKEFKQYIPMNKYEPTGLAQHTIQHAMLTFLWMVYGDNDALHLNQGMAMNMAIEICGEINALEGDAGRGTTGAQTQPYEKFVPGGNPAGGVLPPIPASPYNQEKTSAWHEGLGRDHFALPLRKAQKAGAKQASKEPPAGIEPAVAKSKDAHFLLVVGDGSKKHVVTAPFFGAYARTRQYPPLEFLIEYREFFRAYRCGFTNWLQTMGDPKGAEASAAKYKELLLALRSRSTDQTFESVAQSIYGMPLSGRSAETPSLEWRYLEWLGKGK